MDEKRLQEMEVLSARGPLEVGLAMQDLIAEVRRLRDVVESVEWMGTPKEGDQTCPYCGARRFRIGDGPFGEHAKGCKIADAFKATT